MTRKIRKAVFPVGGLGTRFLPATKAMPKEMLPVVDKPLIQYALEEAAEAGVEQFILVTSRGKAVIEDHFDLSYELEATLKARDKSDMVDLVQNMRPPAGQVLYTRQPEALGLGHAVWCARHLVGDEPFAVLLPDDLIHAKRSCLAQMADVHGETGGNVVAVMDVPREHTARYGVLDPGAEDGRLTEVKGLVEKPAPEVAPSTLSVIGRYILMPEVFEHLAAFERGAGNEIQLTDAMAKMIGHGAFHGFRFEGTRFDCGDKLGFLQATVAMALERDDVGPGLSAYLRELNLD
ncbi:MAG: UTP--glucose-1-phosphate uridylyltransferase GalU [Alphaproteobacteria bacterium]